MHSAAVLASTSTFSTKKQQKKNTKINNNTSYQSQDLPHPEKSTFQQEVPQYLNHHQIDHQQQPLLAKKLSMSKFIVFIFAITLLLLTTMLGLGFHGGGGGEIGHDQATG